MNLPVTWETIKLAIVIPWGFDLIWRRTWETYEELEKPPNYKLFFGTGRTPARRHEIGCELALQWGASHILILGGDEIYPEADMIKRMFKWMVATTIQEWMSRKKVVNCLVPIRGHRPGQGTRPFQPIGMSIDSDTQELRQITREDGPIIRAEVIGTGAMLLEAELIRVMDKPWFNDEYHPGTNSVNVMQDVNFINKLNNEGHQVWCDTQIIVKHIGVLEIDDSYMSRFA